MRVFRWIHNLWLAHLRRIDLQVLWPVCKERAPDIDHARAAFAVHAFNDPAWMALGEDEVKVIISELE